MSTFKLYSAIHVGSLLKIQDSLDRRQITNTDNTQTKHNQKSKQCKTQQN